MPEIVFIKPSFKRIGLSVLLGLSLASCANGPAKHEPRLSAGVLKAQAEQEANKASSSGETRDVVVEANPDQIVRTDDSELSLDTDLPLQDLDASTLEQLLVMNFASFQSDWSLAAQSAISAANSSQDFRVARAATLLALQSADYEGGAIASQTWLALKPDDVNAQNMNIISLVGSKQVEAAKLAIDKQLGEQSVDDYIKQLAGLLVRQSNAKGGFEVADYMTKQHPESAQVLISSAFVAQNFKQYLAAESWVNQALLLKPGWDLAAQLYVNLLNQQNKLTERASFVDQFVDDYPHSVSMRINHASELGRAKEYAQAYDLMLEVLKDDPRNINALQYAASLAEQLEDRKNSRKLLGRALKVEPGNDEVRWSLARLAVLDKKYSTAERLYDDITDESMYVRAQIQVANMRNQTQGVERALKTLKALEPRTSDDYLQVSISRHYLLMGSHQYAEAFDYVNETLVYLPDSLELLYARALVAAELEKVEIAERDLRVIIEKKPDDADALNALGYTLADQTDRYQEAKVLILKALSLRPNQGHILDSMGWVTYKLKDFESAISYLEKAYEASPQAEVAAHLGEVLWESGDHEKANAVFRESFKQDSDNPILNKVIERYGIQLDDAGEISASSDDL